MKFKKILVLGSGGIKIGQAGEFDYSGSQAIKALKEENIKTVLINPNIATIQTDPSLADVVYFQPLNLSAVEDIIEKEKPDGILLSFGGQTALNLGIELQKQKILEKYNIKVLGSSIESIQGAEDRELFKQSLESIQIKTPISYSADIVKDALIAAEKVGYPVMLRSAFSLGGLGSGMIKTKEELKIKASEALSVSPQILIEEYLFGWKEIEYEVIRDKGGQVLTICNMENLDPMGIHTGESIVIAPSQTLNNHDYHLLRSISQKVANHFQIIGECNVQFAMNPENGDYRVIEMNPRLSRSSALASKATGYPLAFVAAKLALGYLLHEIKNNLTNQTSAFFEPALDYIAVKIPRWNTHKFKEADRKIGTEMKSVGEVMSIGKSFPEVIQKAIRMLNIGSDGINHYPYEIADLEKELKFPTDRRIFVLYQFFLRGSTVEEAHKLSLIDKWFLYHIQSIAIVENELKTASLDFFTLRKAKQYGFSDLAIARIKNLTALEIRNLRLSLNVIPVIKQIDTVAGEFKAETNYLYLTYHGEYHDIEVAKNQSVIVLGSGPYSIGSSVEFDWCAVNTAKVLRKYKIPTVIINSNPETVSTDFDESDRLYFEELTEERVQDIADFDSPYGVVVSVGGQTANNLAFPLSKCGYNILGTNAEDIDCAENREKFSALLQSLKIDQPDWQSVSDFETAVSFAKAKEFPILIRPSYVLSGSAMNIAFSEEDLKKYLSEAAIVSKEHPVVISKFIINAKELEVDGVAENGKVVIDAISEHIENAGVHSGDATIVLPPQRLYLETIRKAKKITRQIIKALNITGPFNIQFIAKENELKVIECNLRASRSFPFVSKVCGQNFIEIATEILLKKYKKRSYETLALDHVGVKTPQFSYNRLKGANPVAHVEMSSTGEVACIADRFQDAFYSSWLATDQNLKGKRLLVSISEHYKVNLLEQIKGLENIGWDIFATDQTHDFLTKKGIGSIFVYKVSDKHEPNVATLIEKKEVDLIINIPKKGNSKVQTEGFKIRRLAIDHHISLITNLQQASLLLSCLKDSNKTSPRSWNEYMQNQFT